MRRILFLLLIGLAGTATLVWLGVWQMQRLAWKEDMLARIESEIGAAPVPLPDNPTPATTPFLPVIVEGEILDDEILVLASLKKVGPGYRVIAPFRVGGRTILLDRGFLEITDEDTPRSTGAAEITGNLHWPDEVDGFTPDPDPEARLWFARDVTSMAAELGTEPVLLIAATRTDPTILPMPVDTSGIPNDHLQYAITWFLLALVWVVMTWFFARRLRASEPKGPTT
ncbi:SURF1 family protein [Marinibacterium profundimaris]|uniref:SURF1-like protein n=1 Tax=Marinibacterium profundimaris TaxID=1679460 RepID=A0A225NDV4_9RHOB|nr:SURF1 family protein [Marinibacterium profundimaris]OWU70389.1 cytochrome oxidase biogenesis protein Surf1, facilitates heme A insertion [Marinibacterium profundimaris]